MFREYSVCEPNELWFNLGQIRNVTVRPRVKLLVPGSRPQVRLLSAFSCITFTADGILVGFLQAIITAGRLFVVLYPMYYIFPDADISIIRIIPGTAFAAVSLILAHVLFTTFKSGESGGNLIASILILLTWLYTTGLTVLLGVAVNAVLSNRSKDVDIAPVVGGVAMAGGRDDDGQSSPVTCRPRFSGYHLR